MRRRHLESVSAAPYGRCFASFVSSRSLAARGSWGTAPSVFWFLLYAQKERLGGEPYRLCTLQNQRDADRRLQVIPRRVGVQIKTFYKSSRRRQATTTPAPAGQANSLQALAFLQPCPPQPVGRGHAGLALRLDGDELQGVFAAGDGDGGEGEQFTRGAVTGGKTGLVHLQRFAARRAGELTPSTRLFAASPPAASRPRPCGACPPAER